MTCRSCGGGKIIETGISKAYSSQEQKLMEDDNFVLSRYLSGNIGDHRVIGHVTGIDYGYRSGGDVFLIHKRDLEGMPNLFVKVDNIISTPISEAVIIPPPEKKEVFSDMADVDFVDNTIRSLKQKVEVNSADGLFNKVEEMPTTEELLGDDGGFSIQNIPFLTDITKMKLEEDGVTTKEKILSLGVEGLTKYNYIGVSKAKKILDWAKNAR